MSTQRVTFITHNQKQLLFLDFANADEPSVLRAIAEAKATIAKQPPASLLTLTNVEGAILNSTVSAAIKDLAAHNKPFVKAGAVVGLDNYKRIVFNTLLVLSGRRNLHVFDDISKAKDWLVSQ